VRHVATAVCLHGQETRELGRDANNRLWYRITKSPYHTCPSRWERTLDDDFAEIRRVWSNWRFVTCSRRCV
jgi:hypothetical protein